VKDSENQTLDIATLVEAQKKGYALAQPFYLSDEIFEKDVDCVFYQDWQLAGHVSEILEAGDYFLFEMMKESVIVVRGKDGKVNALANVCRHRGSRVCIAPRGNTKRFT
jgi:phenylpropionate dioxygenase-like ring-hydroxylating dioxygenase large terminal subunit